MQEGASIDERNQMISLIDSHCDTAYELYHRNEGIRQNSCSIDLERAKKYKRYAQFFAIWANKSLDDDTAYESFLQISESFYRELENETKSIALVKSFDEMNSAFDRGKIAAFLAVEDARILGGKIERLDELYRRGVKYLTMTWGGSTCIGGSHDAQGGLTSFGREAVKRCFELGILPDISHSNEETADDIINIAYEYKKPFIATHSNSYSVYPHSRNLRDRHLSAAIELGGIVGISLCIYHLKDMSDGKSGVEYILRHIDRYMELGGENIVGLGCDLDGTDLPDGFFGVDDLTRIAEAMSARGYSDELVNKIFFENYYNFIKNNFA